MLAQGFGRFTFGDRMIERCRKVLGRTDLPDSFEPIVDSFPGGVMLVDTWTDLFASLATMRWNESLEGLFV